MRAGGFPGNPGGLVVSILKTAGVRAPAHQARGRGRRTWRPTERTAGARMVPPGEGNEARGDGRRGVGVSHSTAEAGELSPRDPVEGRGHRQVAPLEGKTANTPRLGPVSTSRQRIAELARQAVGMAVAIAWLPGPAGTRRRVAKLSVEEPDAAEPARPDLWGARVSNDPGLPDRALSGSQASRVSSVVVSPDMGNLTVASDVLSDRSRAPATRVSRVDSVRARSSWRRWRSRFLTTEDRWTPRSSRETLRWETDAGHELERQRDSRVCTARVRSDTEARAGLSSELLRHSAPPARQASATDLGFRSRGL